MALHNLLPKLQGEAAAFLGLAWVTAHKIRSLTAQLHMGDCPHTEQHSLRPGAGDRPQGKKLAAQAHVSDCAWTGTASAPQPDLGDCPQHEEQREVQVLQV